MVNASFPGFMRATLTSLCVGNYATNSGKTCTAYLHETIHLIFHYIAIPCFRCSKPCWLHTN